jgi:polyhydroxyalkanoate synthesis regulator phasin
LSTEDRVAQLESAFVTLTRLVQNHGERFDTHMAWINQLGEAQVNSEQKIAALIDAQIRTEAVVAATNERIDRLTELVQRLAERIGPEMP